MQTGRAATEEANGAQIVQGAVNEINALASAATALGGSSGGGNPQTTSDTNTKAPVQAGGGGSLPPAADLEVTKSGSPDPVLVGDTLTYTVTVKNKGPSSATDVKLTDTLPNNVDFVSATSTQGSCQAGVTCSL